MGDGDLMVDGRRLIRMPVRREKSSNVPSTPYRPASSVVTTCLLDQGTRSHPGGSLQTGSVGDGPHVSGRVSVVEYQGTMGAWCRYHRSGRRSVSAGARELSIASRCTLATPRPSCGPEQDVHRMAQA